jgi:hypothetical protein
MVLPVRQNLPQPEPPRVYDETTACIRMGVGRHGLRIIANASGRQGAQKLTTNLAYAISGEVDGQENALAASIDSAISVPGSKASSLNRASFQRSLSAKFKGA